MITKILIRYIYISNILMKQNINTWSFCWIFKRYAWWIEEYNLGKKRKLLIAFYYLIADMTNIKKLNPIVTELFIRSRKYNISIVFITQSYFKVPKDVKLNSTFFMQTSNKRELQQIAVNHLSYWF